MGSKASRRRAVVITLGVCLLVLFLALGTLNAFNLRFLNPASTLETLIFFALSIVAFLLFVAVLVALVRNFMKLYAEQRSRLLGTRLRTRMLWGAVLVSVVPLVFMFAFSYLLMNRAVDRWFSQPVTQMRSDANTLAAELFSYVAANARSESDSIAVELGGIRGASRHPQNQPPAPADRNQIQRVLDGHALTLQGGFALVYRNNEAVGQLNVPSTPGRLTNLNLPPAEGTEEDAAQAGPSTTARATGSIPQQILQAAQRTDEPFYSVAETDYTLATSGLESGGLVVVGLPIPHGIAAASQRLRTSAEMYWTLFRERRQVRNLYMFLLLMTTLLALFACVWLALNLAKQVTRPVESLADAMEAIAAGDYAHRVAESATEELGELVDSFNAMAADLESARTLAEESTTQLSQVNTTLQARRRELETIIETIPNGLVTLSAERRIVTANRAFSEMLDPGGQENFLGMALDAVIPEDILATLDGLLRRSHRMGSANGECEMRTPAGLRQLSVTVALLEDGGDPTHRPLGYVLVLEDATELLRAQKQSAWKEVARRVAHEIKNPLTPISLNAELIRRHIDRLEPTLTEHGIDSRSPAVIQRATEVISASVGSMRSLVDQFSALAEFPSARPRPADLNAIVENSLALFAGRLGNIRVRRNLAPDLPLVFADPNALQRALSNLIDNAAEAMHDSLLRELTLSTRAQSSGMIELCVADTGPGLTDDMRERLFLPYFSTKQRGTGLGLSIAAKIVQEHQGSIRAEKNVPAGARFIVELRPANEPESEVASTWKEGERPQDSTAEGQPRTAEGTPAA